MANGTGPIQPQDLEEMNQRLKDLDEAEKLIRQAKTAGIDIAEAEERAKELRARLLRMKTAFFPGK